MQITISITAPQGSINQDILNLDVGPDMTLGDLKAVIQSDTDVSPTSQHIFHNGQPLHDLTKTLQQCQVKENDMLGMVVQQETQPTGPRTQQSSRQTQRSQNNPRGQGSQDDPRNPDPELIRLQALGNAAILEQLRNHDPSLADVVSDPVRFRQAWQAMVDRKMEAEADKEREMRALEEDPFNAEAQAKIEEMIRQERVMENLQDALDHTPEAFGRVIMLYIDVEVNGHRVKAFVDSGAQATIMSPGCAERCGIMRLIDKRYAGIARGVGTAKILGRVHSAQIKIGPLHLPCMFTVMEGKDVDLLLGLDMLKRHQACIDLSQGVLRIQDVTVPFLGEAEIPKEQQEALESEPTVEGPSGMKTGAISGAVSSSQQSTAPSTQSGNFRGAGQSLGAATSASSPQPASTTAAQKYPDAHVSKLMEMGFSREEAVNALEMAGGNVEVAAGILFG